MHLPRAPLRHLAICSPLVLSGCLLAFDADNLTGGNRTPGTTNLNALCVDFSSYPVGAPAPNWVEGSGTWRVVDRSREHVFAQTDDPTAADPAFVAWYGANDWADASVSAVTRLADYTYENCVLSRLQDKASFYALCLRQGRSAPYWKLERVVAGNATRLADGDLANGDVPHTLALRASGTTLTPTIDGSAQASVEDAQFAHGAVGVSTDGAGGFSTLCMARL